MRKLPTLIACLLLLILAVPAQQTSRDRGIELYKQGNKAEAVSVLASALKLEDFKSDAEAWNYLGLAYFDLADYKQSRKALEKAVKLQPQSSVYNANLAYVYMSTRQTDKAQRSAEQALRLDPANITAHYTIGTAALWEGDLDGARSAAEKILALDPGFPQAYLLKSDVLMAQLGKRVASGSTIRGEIDLLKQNVELLESGLQRSQNRPGMQLLEESLEAARAFHAHFARDRSVDPGVSPEPGVTPLRLISKPKATYTDNARSAGVSGSVRLVLLMGANGRILHILKLKGLGYGLDEQAIRAAKQIRFEPKMKDGKPVTTVITLEYGFQVY
jgi:TonB family protein